MKEVWEEIKGYEGLYFVSNLGRVVSRVREGAKGGVLIFTKNSKGYLTVGLCKHGTQNKFRVNRLVAKAFISNPHNKPEVNHINGNKKNNRVDNLEWVTHQENIDHAVENSLILKGENSDRTNLTDKDVLCIREYLKDESYSIKDIARIFNVSQRAVSFISLGQTWKHLLKEDETVGKHRSAKGSKNAASKLNEEKVKEIKKFILEGKSQRDIGRMFGVDKAVIGRIKNGTAWKHVK